MANFMFYFLKLVAVYSTFSIPSFVNGQGAKNVALINDGAWCDAFPIFVSQIPQSKACTGAFDNVTSPSTQYRWSFLGTPINSMIQVQFQEPYDINLLRAMPLPVDNRTFKDVKVEFDLGFYKDPFIAPITVQAVFNNLTPGYVWEEIVINPPVRARRARLTVLTSHITIDLDKAYNGLLELQYWVLPATTAAPTTSTTTDTTTTTTIRTTPTPTTPTPTTVPTTTTTTTPTTTTSTTTSTPVPTPSPSPATPTPTSSTPTPTTTASTTTSISPSPATTSTQSPSTTTTTTNPATTTPTTTTSSTTTAKSGRTASDEDQLDLLPIIIGVVAAAVIIIIIVAAVICCRHRRGNNKEEVTQRNIEKPGTIHDSRYQAAGFVGPWQEGNI